MAVGLITQQAENRTFGVAQSLAKQKQITNAISDPDGNGIPGDQRGQKGGANTKTGNNQNEQVAEAAEQQVDKPKPNKGES